MRSGTSCFNWTLYRKNMARFWPVWAVYGVMWLFAMPVQLLNSWKNAVNDVKLGFLNADEVGQQIYETVVDIPRELPFGVAAAAVFAVLCAMAVFSYLYSSRSVCMMHTLPLRRRDLFITQYAAGLSFMVLPHLAVAALTAALVLLLVPAGLWSSALAGVGLWLGVQSGCCLFFFSFAAFCAMFTGNTLALPAFYGILNFLVVAIYGLLSTLMAEFFYGLSGWGGSIPAVVEWFTPVMKLMEACDYSTVYDAVGQVTGHALDDPGAVAVYAVAGIVLAVAAALVYNVRHAESAGDVVAIGVVRPVFRCGVSFCMGLSVGMCTALFLDCLSDRWMLTAFVLVWTVVGWFAAEMLLRRSFRVRSAWKGAAAMAAVVALLCVGCFRDFFGIENRVPALDQVESVSVGGSILGYPYDSGRGGTVTLSAPEQVQKVLDLHRAVLDAHQRGDDAGSSSYDNTYNSETDYVYFRLDYALKGGGTLSRRYYSVMVRAEDVEREGTVSHALNEIIQDEQVVRTAYGLDQYDLGAWIAETWEGGVYHADRDHSITAYLDGVCMENGDYETVYLDEAAGEDLAELWQAVLADFEEGTLGRRYLFEYGQERLDNTCRTDLCFEFLTDRGKSGGRYYNTLTITLTPDAEHVMAWLRENDGLDREYTIPPYRDYAQVYQEIPTYPFPETEEDVVVEYGDAFEGAGVIGGADGPTAIFVS